MTNKVCVRCGNLKDCSEFYHYSYREYLECKACTVAIHRERNSAKAKPARLTKAEESRALGVRTCSNCKITLPLSKFSGKKKDANGEYTSYRSKCHACTYLAISAENKVRYENRRKLWVIANPVDPKKARKRCADLDISYVKTRAKELFNIKSNKELTPEMIEVTRLYMITQRNLKEIEDVA